MFTRTRISTLLIFFMLVATLVPLASISFSAYQSTKLALEKTVGTKFNELAQRTINTVDRMLHQRKTDLEKWSRIETFQEMATDDANGTISKMLADWKREYGIYSAIYCINEGGKIIASSENTSIGRTVNNEVWYKSAIQPSVYSRSVISSKGIEATAQIGGLQYDSLTGSYGVNLSVPIFSQTTTRRLGLLVSRLNWSELFNITNAVAVTESGQAKHSYALMINRKGDIITGPGALLTKDQKSDEILFSKNLLADGYESAKLALGGKHGYLLDSNKAGEKQMVGYANSHGHLDFPGLGWAVLIVQNASESFRTAYQIKNLSFVIIGITILIVLATAIYFSRMLASQFSGLETLAESLSKGYFSERTEVTQNTEVGELGQKLNIMAENVQGLVEEERKLRKAAEISNRAKGEFLADIGQELRGPLNSVIEMSEVLLDTSLTDDQRAFTKSMRKASCALLALTNDIRDISKIETGQGSVEQTPFNLKSVIEEVAELLGATGQHMGVEVVVYYDDGVPRNVLGDSVRIHQVFTNITAHAMKLTSKEQLLVSVHTENVTNSDVDLRIVVEDSGHGLDKDHLSYLFSQEDLAEGSKTEIEEASGELATSKRIVELMGGSFGTITSTENGFVFWLRLRLQIDPEKAGQSNQRPEIENIPVIVASGNQVMSQVIHRYFENWNVKAHFVETQGELLKALEKTNGSNPVALVGNSFLTGGEERDKIQELLASKKTNVVSISALSEQFENPVNDNVSFVGHLTKPIRSDDLADIIKKASK